MIVKGPTLHLRTVRERDLEWLYEQQNSLDARGDFFPIGVTSETDFRQRFQEHGFWADDHGRVLICANDTKAIVGMLVFFKATPYWDCYEIGYRLFDVTHSGRGIMTEALTLFTYVLFATKRVHRLELKIVPENKGSVRVAEKCGYRLEGVAREAWYHRGRHLDMAVYSLLRPEFPVNLDEVMARLELPPGITAIRDV